MNLGITTSKTLLVFVLAILLVSPLGVAEGAIVECDGPAEGPGKCDWGALMQTAQRLIEWLVMISVFVAAIAFTWAGFVYVTAGGDESKVKKAHTIFKNVLIGFILVLAAWLIVYAIITALGLRGGISLLNRP